MTKLLICLSLLMAHALKAQEDTLKFEQRTATLSKVAMQVLDRRFGVWNLCNSYVYRYDDNSGLRVGKRYADLITGDFDGNQQRDYAALVNTDGEGYLVVMLKKGRSYSVHIIDSTSHCDQEVIIGLVPKGTTERDLESNKRHKHLLDAIGFGYYEKAGGTYFYHDGAFRYISTSD